MSLFDPFTQETTLCELKKDIIENRVPINANIFITNNCNFECLHCYVQSQKNRDEGSLSIKQWEEILNILKRKGCLSITFSGGEVLSSKKFPYIYEYAYLLNFRISLITNLSLLSENHLKLFSQKKPDCITVSLYGSSNETYEKFCGVKNGWDRVSKNIIDIKQNAIPIKLQTVLNTINFHELLQMKNFAELHTIPFFAFRNITCEVTGSARPLQFQITPQQELESFKIMNDGEEFLQATQKYADMWSEGYKRCFAGLTNCYIDCKGNLFLCSQCQTEKYNIFEHGFDTAWKNILKIREAEIETSNKCSTCPDRRFCGKCTPIANKLQQAVGFPFPDCDGIRIIEEFFEEMENKSENYK